MAVNKESKARRWKWNAQVKPQVLWISERINNVTFRLELSYPMIAKGIHDTFYCSLCQEPSPPIDMDGQTQEYEVEEILVSRRYEG